MQQHPDIEDEVKAENAVRIIKEKGWELQYAKGAIEELTRQLQTARASSKIQKLTMAIRRWELALTKMEER